MSFSKRKRKELLAHCDELRDDDGVDPREYFKPTSRRVRRDRKAKQLCQQIAETLSLVLSGEFADELLHNLEVVSVEPAPDASQLLVTVRLNASPSQVTAEEVQQRLARVAGRLRSEVAAAITRKRAPKLRFEVQVLPRDREDQR